MNKQKALHPRNESDRQYVSRKEGGIELARLEDCIDVSMQENEKYTKKNEEIPIIADSNRKGNIKTNKKTSKTRKQKWEEKQLQGECTWEDLDMATNGKHQEMKSLLASK